MLATSSIVLANDYPTRPIKVIVPFPPGGGVDIVARIVIPKFAEQIGQPVIIENKAGAGGTLGSADAAKSKPDGYTLLMVYDSHALNQYFYKLSYDTFTSYDYLMELVSIPMLLVTTRTSSFNTVPEFISYAKTKDALTYGSVGPGSSNHLNGFILSEKANINTMHIPYKGGGPMLLAGMTGEVDFLIATMPIVLPQLKEGGKLKAIAVGTKHRTQQFPNLPTIAETLPGYEASAWVGLVGPAGLPKDVQAKIVTAMKQTLNSPEIKNKMTADGFNIVASNPAEFLAKVRADSDVLGKFIARKQIKAD
jgi:tripartite-type tricarboxylate transporter receptor subunit TctC